MASFAALLRAVNVGGTGKLAVRDLEAIWHDAGLADVRTYIASGNVVFTSEASEPELKATIKARLLAHAGKPMGVLLRNAAEMVAAVAANPFPNAPGNRASPEMLDAVTGQAPADTLHLGLREIYVHYGAGMATTRLRIPAAGARTARNMNTVSRLADMAAGRA